MMEIEVLRVNLLQLLLQGQHIGMNYVTGVIFQDKCVFSQCYSSQ